MNKKTKNALVKIGSRDKFDVFRIAPGGVKNVAGTDYLRGYSEDTDLSSEISTPGPVTIQTIQVGKKACKYAAWGDDDQLPFLLVSLLRRNMVTAQCMQFNTLCTYSQGIIIADRKTGERSDDPEIREFCMRNSLHELYLNQATDMQHFSLTFTLLQLCNDGSRIVNMLHREACYCRFEQADEHNHIKHVIYGNWRDGQPKDPKRYELLDMRNPLDDLLVRMGKKPDPRTGMLRQPSRTRTFMVVSRMPTPCFQYYPRTLQPREFRLKFTATTSRASSWKRTFSTWLNKRQGRRSSKMTSSTMSVALRMPARDSSLTISSTLMARRTGWFAFIT